MTKKKAEAAEERLPEDDRAAELAQEQAAQAASEADGFSPHVAALADEVEGILEAAEFDIRKLSGGLRDTMLDIFRHRREPWDAMKEKEQGDVARLIQIAVDAALVGAVHMIAEDGRPSISARLAKFASQGGKFQVTLLAVGGPEMASDLARLDGHEVLIISADAAKYQGADKPALQPDQAPLEFDERPMGEEMLGDELVHPKTGEVISEAELYAFAIERVRAEDNPSISFVQRELNISTELADRFIKQMEADGIVSAPDVTTKRSVFAYEPPALEEEAPRAEAE